MKALIPKDKRLLVSSIAALGLILLFLIFVYFPKRKLITELRSQIKSIEGQIEVTQATLGDLDKLGQILGQMQRELASFESRLPRREQISSVLAELSNLAKLSSVEVVSIKPEEPVPLLDHANNPIILDKGPLKCLQVNLRLRAPYKAIAEYVKSLQESLAILATIDEITIARGDEKTPAGLDVKLVFTVHICG